ncbi:MAG: hypothetical protein JJE27_08395, partial [Thermoleophilia bacterium]|nr:hypothetical protein [Thermoleophilia bacterium]
DKTLRVHLHSNSPDSAMALFEQFGVVVDVELEDMHEMTAARSARLAGGNGAVAAARLPRGRCGVVAVVSAGGIAQLFRELGATVVDGGVTLNPSTAELVAAIDSAPEDEVVVLPNSSNVILAAERAAELANKPATVVPTVSQQAGLSAVVALNPNSAAADNAQTMCSLLVTIRSGGVAQAVRDDVDGRFRIGDAVGFINEDLIAWGDPALTLRSVLARLGDEAEVMTCIAGASAPLSGDEVRGLAPPETELELLDGGQPNWWWLIAAE